MKYESRLNLDDPVDGSLNDRENLEWEERPKTAEELWAYRQKMFGSEEIEKTLPMLNNYRASFEVKDNIGLFSEMELAERYWSGDFGIPEDFDDPGSNTNIINANIETQVSSMVDQTIDVELKPYEPADKPYVLKARMIIDRIKDANNLSKKVERHERRLAKFGTGIFRVMYNKDLMDDKIGCPEIKVCNPAYIYPDPNIVSLDDLQEAEFIIETIPKSIYWAEEKFGKERAWAIAPGYNPIENSFVFNDNMDANYDVAGDHYLHILYWTHNKEGKLRLIQLSGCGIVLSDTDKDKEYDYFTDDGRYPYFFTTYMEREGTIWGKSICSLLFSLQDEIDDYTNMIRRNARLNGNPIKVVAVNSGIEIDKLDNTAGQVIPTNDVNAIKYLDPPNMPAFIQQRRSEAMQERFTISRVSDQQSGIRQSGVKTATESLNLAQSANVTVDTRKTVLQTTLNAVFRYCFDLALNYWNVGMFFQDDDDFVYFNPTDLKEIPMMKPATPQFVEMYMKNNPDSEPPKFMLNPNEKRKVKLVFNIQVGAGLPSNKAVAFNYILEAYKGGLLSKKETRELLIEYIKLPVETVDNSVIALEEKQIEYQSLMLDAQMQQMMAPPPVQEPSMVGGGDMSGIEQMQAQPNARATAVENPRPNTLSIMKGEQNLV